MWLPFELITENLAMDFEYLVPLIAFICGLTFYAINFKLGTILNFLLFMSIFIWFFEANINYVPALILGFINLVMLAFSLYAVNERAATGGRIT